MLDHLLVPEFLADDEDEKDPFTPEAQATTADLLRAKVNAIFPDAESIIASWDDDGPTAPHSLSPEDALAARNAFAAATGMVDSNTARSATTSLKTPEAVQHLVAMLTTYDWAFVDQAKEIRGYIVAQLMEESKNPKAEVRLKALKLLGDVTEIGLFTQRVEVTNKNLSDEEVERKLKERLERLTIVSEVTDATIITPQEKEST